MTQPLPAITRASADLLGKGDDDPLWPAHIGHAPDVLVLAAAADQPVSVGSQPGDDCGKVVDLKADVAQAQFIGHRERRSGLMVGPGEAREL